MSHRVAYVGQEDVYQEASDDPGGLSGIEKVHRMNDIFLFFVCAGLLRTRYSLKEKKLWIMIVSLASIILINRILT